MGENEWESAIVSSKARVPDSLTTPVYHDPGPKLRFYCAYVRNQVTSTGQNNGINSPAVSEIDSSSLAVDGGTMKYWMPALVLAR